MEVFRISREKYSSRLSSSGTANRWNHDNEYVIYTAEARSLATVELIAHRNAIMKGSDYKMITISFPDEEDLITRIPIKTLPEKWQLVDSYSKLQDIGSSWYHTEASLILKVPSAIIPQEFNYIINTRHPDFKDVLLVRTKDYSWDNRLL